MAHLQSSVARYHNGKQSHHLLRGRQVHYVVFLVCVLHQADGAPEVAELVVALSSIQMG